MDSLFRVFLLLFRRRVSVFAALQPKIIFFDLTDSFCMKNPATKTLSLIAASALLLAACKPQANELVPQVIRPVKTITVGAAADSPEASFSAEIKPRIESQLAFRVGGKVVERLVDIGTIVKKDQVLMRLDSADLQLSANAALAQVAAAKANDDVAQAALKRSQDLARQNFISQGALDQAIGTANSARAALQAAQANSALGVNATQYGALRADSDGVVTALSVEVGQVVSAGMPVMRMAVGRDKDLVFSIPEAMLSVVKRGTAVGVKMWSQQGTVLSATVRDVAAMADPLTRTYAVKASLKDSGNAAMLGSTATVLLPTRGAASSAGLSIPLSAVIESQGKTAVWIVQAGVVKKQIVTLAAAPSADEQIWVTSGLAPGSIVVVAGTHVLTDGQKVSSTQP